MPKLPVVSGQDVVRALTRAGFEVHHQKGSHIILNRETRRRRGARFAQASHQATAHDAEGISRRARSWYRLVFPFDVQRDLFFRFLRSRELHEHAELADVDERAFERPVQTNSERTRTYTFRSTTNRLPEDLGGVLVRHHAVRSYERS